LKSTQKEDLLLALLDGAFDVPPWTRFLDLLRNEVAADYSSLVFRPPGMPSNTVFHLYSGRRSPPHVERLYKESFFERDPTPYHAMHEGRIYSLKELLRPGDPASEAYIREVMAPSGMNAMRMVRVTETSGVSAWMIVTRTKGDFTGKAEMLLSGLVPYLRSVLRNFVALERERTSALLSGQAIHRLNYGWIALDANARVLETDAQGQTILDHSQLLHCDPDGRFSAVTRKQMREIATAVKLLANTSDARPRAMVLSRDPWLDMLLVRANREAVSARSSPAVVVYVHGDSALSADRCEQLAQLFDLLPSESRLALALSRGMSITEAAGELGLTVETARTYSKKIYIKMGARSQADLVRFIHRSVLRIV
jgi:DNA-binding NarL/FixJ family response regulator